MLSAPCVEVRVVMSAYEETPAPIPAPVPASKPAPRPRPPEPPPGRSPFPLILALAFAAVVAASFVVERGARPAAAAPAAPAAPAEAKDAAKPAESAAVPAPASTTAAVTADEVNALRGDLEALAKKVDTLPKPEPTADLKPIYEKIDGLAKSVDAGADVSRKVEAVEKSAADGDKALAALKDEVAALKSEVAVLKARPATTAAPTTTDAKPAESGMNAAAMTAAVEMFQAGKYPEARAAFAKLPADDARVLYYEALASGFATKKWDGGEAVQLATKGAQAEKAGKPAKAEIDAAFTGLTEAQGKKWLDYYRGTAK